MITFHTKQIGDHFEMVATSQVGSVQTTYAERTDSLDGFNSFKQRAANAIDDKNKQVKHGNL
jgi:hypothetical protein